MEGNEYKVVYNDYKDSVYVYGMSLIFIVVFVIPWVLGYGIILKWILF